MPADSNRVQEEAAPELAAAPARPRILVVGPGPGGAGGIATVVERFLSSPLDERFDLVVARTHRDGRASRKGLQAIRGIGRAARLLASRRVDLVYIHTSSGASFRRKTAVATLARVARRPYILHVHAGGFAPYYHDAARWERALVRTTLSHAALVVTLSRVSESEIARIGDFQTRVIPNFVPMPPEPARLEFRHPRIVSLGRLGDAKGSRTLVRSLSLLGDTHGDARLVLAGDGDRQQVLEEAERLGVQDRVEAPGWIGPAARHQTLSTATIFALPSRSEALPMALLEAMAYGLPAVVTPVGGIPEVFQDERHGFVVAPDDPAAVADRLRALLDDPDTARAMGERARADVGRLYSVDVVVTELCAVIDDALGFRRSGVKVAG